MKQRNLPIGIQEFDAIRRKDYYYVDKTHLIGKLIQEGQFYFLSRPRRFGKSLLVSTIEHLFLGHQSLFEGLDIYDKWDWTQKHPVVRLSFDGGELTSPELIAGNVHEQLETIESNEELGSSLSFSGSAAGRFRRILELLHRKYKKQVVVLIDEYDRPILDVLLKPKLAEANRQYVRGLYGMIKGCSKYISFTLITGISMLSKMNLFSAINNLLDITLDPEYASICGYTEHDLKTVFAPETKNFDLSKIRDWYDGYHWGSVDEAGIYNPHSVLHLFKRKSFKSWWFQGCVPQHIYEILTRKKRLPVDIGNQVIDSNIISTFDVERINIHTLLFQSGYLTIAEEIHEYNKIKYRLTFPNLEVKQSFNEEFFRYLIDDDGTVDLEFYGKSLIQLLAHHDFKGFKQRLHKTFACFTHPYFQGVDLSDYECWYLTIVHASFMALGSLVVVEEVTSHGRSDMVIRYQQDVFVMEFKATTDENVDKVAASAIEQIKDRHYLDKYQSPGNDCYLIALVFHKEKRNISKLQAVKLPSTKMTG
ncbi:MAG: AAA family ATPase [Proteobacteria bacterium]|nr:AAA family ATPase [Pseudomonadota bacterium]